MSDRVYFPYGMPIRSVWKAQSGENVSADFLVELLPGKYLGSELPSVETHITLTRCYVVGHELPFDRRWLTISDEIPVELAPLPPLKCPRLGPTYEEVDKCNKAIQEFVETEIRAKMGEILVGLFGDPFNLNAFEKWKPYPKENRGFSLPKEAWLRGRHDY